LQEFFVHHFEIASPSAPSSKGRGSRALARGQELDVGGSVIESRVLLALVPKLGHICPLQCLRDFLPFQYQIDFVI
jgi:hypothetical protein